MSDEELREAERAWRANEADQVALAGLIAARYRAGLPVGLELLERRVHPARCFDLPVPARFWTEDPQGERVDLGETPAGGEGLAVPPLGWLWARPDDTLEPKALPALLGAEPDGLELDLRSDGEPEAVVRCLAGSLLTALRLRCAQPLSTPALAALAGLPRLARLGYECATGAVTRDELACLARIPNLSALELRSRLSPGALTSLAGARSLLDLTVEWRTRRRNEAGRPADEELTAMARGLPRLRSLDLRESGRNHGDAFLSALAESCRVLRSLALPAADPGDHQAAPRVSDEGVRRLRGLPLEVLSLNSELVTDACADTLAELPLRRAELWTELTSVGLSRLPPALTGLKVRLRAGSGGLPWLRRLTALRELSLFLAEDVTDEDLGALSALERLEVLDLPFERRGRTTWRGLLPLRGCSALRRLWLSDIPPLEGALEVLLNLPLRHLQLGGPGADDAAARALAAHSTLEFLSLEDGHHLTDAGLLPLAAAPRLTVARVMGCPRVTVEGCRALARAAGERLYLMLDMERVTPD